MQCLSPVYISNPDYAVSHSSVYEEEFKISSGVTEFVVDEASPKIAVPCGCCEACIQSTAQEWRVRIMEENNVSKNALFFTLTYNDDSVPLVVSEKFNGESVVVRSVSKRDIQLFLKRIREEFRKLDHESTLRYYIVSEYGPNTYRPHYHGILFNVPSYVPNKLWTLKKTVEIIDRCWRNGFVMCDKVIPERIGYVTKYLSCSVTLPYELNRPNTKPFRMMSQGLGRNYLENPDVYFWHKDGLKTYYVDGKYHYKLPRYYKRKIFNDEELKIIHDRNVQYLLNKESNFQKENYEHYLLTGYTKQEMQVDKFKRNFKNKYLKKRKDV